MALFCYGPVVFVRHVFYFLRIQDVEPQGSWAKEIEDSAEKNGEES